MRAVWLAFAVSVLLLVIAAGTGLLERASARIASRQLTASGATKEPINGTAIFRLGSSYLNGTGYGRYRYVIVGRPYAREAAELPGLVMPYMSGVDVTPFNTGVTLSQASSQNWLLRDASGAFVQSKGYPGVYLGDIGDPGYQQAWLQNVLAFLSATKVKGVYIDNVIADIGHWTVGEHIYPAKYPDRNAWQAAMLSFIRAVGPALKSHGYYVLVNAESYIANDPRFNDGSLTAGWWRVLAPSVSGLLTEYWMQNPVDLSHLRSIGTEWDQEWVGWQRLVSVAQKAGADFFGLTYGSSNDVRTMRFGKASFLMDWNGKGGAFVFSAIEDRSDPFNPAWMTDLGQPLRPKIRLAAGVWRRRFEHGIVVVNATNSAVNARIAGVVRTIGPVDAAIVSD